MFEILLEGKRKKKKNDIDERVGKTEDESKKDVGIIEADEDPPEDEDEDENEDPESTEAGSSEEDDDDADSEDDEEADDDEEDTDVEKDVDTSTEEEEDSEDAGVDKIKKYRLIEFYKEFLKLCKDLKSDTSTMNENLSDEVNKEILVQYGRYIDDTIEKIEFVLENYTKKFSYRKLLMIFIQLKTTIDLIINTIKKITPKK